MRDGWKEVELGELVEKRSDFTAVDPNSEYVILGVQRSGWGFVEREPILGRDQKFTKLMQIEQNDLVYRTITAFEAPAAVAGPDEQGLFVTPQTFPVFKIDHGRLLPEYMRLLTTWPVFHEAMSTRCTGTVLRRKTLSVKAFRSIPVPLPPLEEQRRTVDLIGSLNYAIEAAGATVLQSQTLQAEALLAVTARMEGPVKQLDEVFEYVLGGSWGSKSGEDEVDVVALGTTAYAEGRTEVDPSLGSMRSLSRKRASDRELRHGDIVLERSGGSSTQPVGRVLRMTSDTPHVVPSDFMRLLRVDCDVADPSYVFWVLWSMYQAGASLPFQKHTTSIRNLNIPDYLRSYSIVTPDRSDQTSFVELAESMLNVTRAATASVDRLRELRSNLLTVLLSGERELPESYDELTEEVAA